MLTNTVILFLRDLLPMFIMFAYLRSIFQYNKTNSIQLTSTICVSLAFAIFTMIYFEVISNVFEGTGIEWLKIVLIFISFVCFLSAHIPRFINHRSYIIALAAGCLLTLHFSSFLLYFSIYLAYDNLVYELFIGCAVGTGICVSFYFLFGFLVQEFWHAKFAAVVLFFWSLFVASQLSSLSNYLHQIDIVNFGNNRLIDLSDWVNDDSEYGFILKALTGFDSSPSVFYGVVVLIGFVSIYSFSMMNRHRLLGENNE